MRIAKFQCCFLNLAQCAKANAILDGVNNVVLHLINSNLKKIHSTSGAIHHVTQP